MTWLGALLALRSRWLICLLLSATITWTFARFSRLSTQTTALRRSTYLLYRSAMSCTKEVTQKQCWSYHLSPIPCRQTLTTRSNAKSVSRITRRQLSGIFLLILNRLITIQQVCGMLDYMTICFIWTIKPERVFGSKLVFKQVFRVLLISGQILSQKTQKRFLIVLWRTETLCLTYRNSKHRHAAPSATFRVLELPGVMVYGHMLLLRVQRVKVEIMTKLQREQIKVHFLFRRPIHKTASHFHSTCTR